MAKGKWKERREARVRQRLEAKLQEAIAAGVMTEAEADAFRERAKALPWMLIIELIIEIAALIWERFKNR